MTGLQPPPKDRKPGGLFLRLLVLVVLAAAAGVVIFSAVTEQRLGLVEDTSVDSLGLATVVTVDGTSLNVTREGDRGGTPLVLLHDADIAGGVIWDGVVSDLDPGYDVLRIDLPGFGLSERFPAVGPPHTVSAMAGIVADLIDKTWTTPAVFVGVGLGGEVASEIAVTRPEEVASLLMIDVDFFKQGGWVPFFERLAWVGRSATFTFDTGGIRASERWDPDCGTGGWCPTASQAAARDLAATIVGTTDSFQAFRKTPEASLVPSKLGEISVPVRYLWSQSGHVPRSSVDKVLEAIPDMEVDAFADAWKVHLDQPSDVAAAIAASTP